VNYEMKDRTSLLNCFACVNISQWPASTYSTTLHPLLVGSILKPVVRKVYALDQITNAHEDVLRPGALGNIVIGIE
jgi:NADPH2:quinone reductase